MPAGDTPPVLGGRAPDWWSSDSKWKIPLIILGAVLFCAAIFTTVGVAARNSGAYSGALDRARASAVVREALGSPIRDGIFFTGKIEVSGSSGRANLSIPIQGPKGRGALYVEASKDLGEWQFIRLVVVVKATGESIDLSEAPRPR
jgi:Cytochrome oxidase complex assembly protein 1